MVESTLPTEWKGNMSEITALSETKLLHLRDGAIAQMQFARAYLKGMIESYPAELWLTIPSGATSHLLWQVGHIAVAQYGLMLFRQRGRAEGDVQIMPGWLRKNFGRGTTASVDADYNPTPEEMLSFLDQIHDVAMSEVPNLTAESLARPADLPYATYPMNIGALLFAPIHESIHIGQIGTLRRLLGLPPIR